MAMNVTTAPARAARRRAGWLAIASGIAAILAFAFLIGALVGREAAADEQAWKAGIIQAGFWDALFRAHDVAAILQMLAMIPVVGVLHAQTLRQRSWGPAAAQCGRAGFALVALTLALVLFAHGSDMLYMLPQGLVGIWLIAVGRLQPVGVSRPVCWLGTVTGIGLVIVALGDVGIALALGPGMLTPIGPVPTQVDPAGVTGALNLRSHAVLDIGTMLGVFTYPVWAMLAGRGLLQTAGAADKPVVQLS